MLVFNAGIFAYDANNDGIWWAVFMSRHHFLLPDWQDTLLPCIVNTQLHWPHAYIVGSLVGSLVFGRCWWMLVNTGEEERPGEGGFYWLLLILTSFQGDQDSKRPSTQREEWGGRRKAIWLIAILKHTNSSHLLCWSNVLLVSPQCCSSVAPSLVLNELWKGVGGACWWGCWSISIFTHI